MLKIDLYNNHDVFIKEQRQDWTAGRWLKDRGIRLQDLTDHQQISDVITIVRICDDLWSRMNQYEQAVMGQYWNIVYNKKYPLTKKFWNKFERIVKAIDNREIIKAQQRHQIQQLRKQTQNPFNNTDLNNEANRSVPAQSKLYEKGQTGVPLSVDLPW